MHELETYTSQDVVKIVVGNKVSRVSPLLSLKTYRCSPLYRLLITQSMFPSLYRWTRSVTSLLVPFRPHVS